MDFSTFFWLTIATLIGYKLLVYVVIPTLYCLIKEKPAAMCGIVFCLVMYGLILIG